MGDNDYNDYSNYDTNGNTYSYDTSINYDAYETSTHHNNASSSYDTDMINTHHSDKVHVPSYVSDDNVTPTHTNHPNIGEENNNSEKDIDIPCTENKELIDSNESETYKNFETDLFDSKSSISQTDLYLKSSNQNYDSNERNESEDEKCCGKNNCLMDVFSCCLLCMT